MGTVLAICMRDSSWSPSLSRTGARHFPHCTESSYSASFKKEQLLFLIISPSRWPEDSAAAGVGASSDFALPCGLNVGGYVTPVQGPVCIVCSLVSIISL